MGEQPMQGLCGRWQLHLIALGLLAAASCGPTSAASPHMEFFVDASRCTCTIDHYAILFLGEQPVTHLPCLRFSQQSAPGKTAVMSGLPLSSGEKIRLALLAYCDSGSCVKCFDEDTVTVEDQASVTLKLDATANCFGGDPLVRPSTSACPGQ